MWTTFNQEVYDFSQSELTPYLKLESEITINQMKVFQRAADAGCESDIESSLEYTTFGILVELLRLMGVDSSFSRGKGDSSVILEPDYIWKVLVENRKQAHFRLPVEVKPFWSFPRNVNLAVKYLSDLEDSKAKSGSTESVTVRGVNQMYGYSSFNYSRYAALTTQHELLCFKRSGIPSSVKISNPIPLAGVTYLDHHVSYMTCWLFLLWSARENGIYASPAGSPSTTILPDHKSLPLRPINAPIRGLYELRAINANQIHFTQTLTVAKGAVGTVVTGDLHNHPGLKFKLYDAYHDSRYVEISMKEVAMYKTLESLQGMVIPRFYGYFNYHGIILIAMEDCGSPLTVEEYSLYETRAGNCITALQKLGIYHQDLEARDGKYPNILKSQCGTKIRIVDFNPL
ncbi:hypothetical protein BCR33DRAFT_566381 [Rhizoclosmatium globosum]|uniref:Protein kinase domain-containing protein n=1 Tax=Rhizoclosmatium globosum TaxID=329046 RepID=A0A1Y2B6J7_9FUNG|nr:hypothetical protein BCR33DRAFT_566381 [Rhizoclosmatium globosum]|eukprot:ORY30468.1 hypothetical protein BCR33DRAFT_566381 [Rhizoclosmatium globosum]